MVTVIASAGASPVAMKAKATRATARTKPFATFPSIQRTKKLLDEQDIYTFLFSFDSMVNGYGEDIYKKIVFFCS